MVVPCAAAKPMHPLVVIPTYDERDNVGRLVPRVREICPECEVLVVDDASPDGTADVVRDLREGDRRVHLMERKGKLGLGTAYTAGFRWGLERDFDHLFEMDADFSHDPAAIPDFLEAVREYDLVLGSRYIHGISIVNWPLRRLALSKAAALYVRLITGLPVMDPTGGYKCFRRAVLEAIDLSAVHSNGYAFQIEITHRAWMLGFRIKEIPIIFVDRHAGSSKMSREVVREALRIVWRLAAANRFRRRPTPKYS